ncbi:hypothetical protein DCC79_02500 [bacterium]|nr:hypothetical protein [Chloroflexi bacterium CFX6]RIL12139.1 MAG: hypothetical protein DCC79_02500 [bacterium]
MNRITCRIAALAVLAAFAGGLVPGLRTAPSVAAGEAIVTFDPNSIDGLGTLADDGSGYFKCRRGCAAKAHEAFKTCRAGGGDGKACADAARAAMDACMSTDCANVKPPCRLGCAEAAGKAFRACVDGGGEPKDCASQARESLKACVAQCPPPPWACRVECQKTGAEAYRTCRDGGGDRKACAAEAEAAAKACVEANCNG